MKSESLRLYKTWLQTATPEQVTLVDDIYELCEKNYAAGGDVVCECFSPDEVLNEIPSLEEAKKFCRLHVEQEKNARWGEDSDPQRPQWKG